MFKRILPIATRNLPLVFKISAFTISLMALKNYTDLMRPINCMNFPTFSHRNVFAEVLPNIIRVEHHGEIVGYAYCFSEKLIVCAGHELFNDKLNRISQYEFYLGETKLNTRLKVIGHFEHLTFLQASDNIIPVLPSKDVDLYTPIHVIQSRSYLSIRNGYYVANESGYGVINGKGEVGSAVLNDDGLVGIVSHIGRDYDQGFLRMIMWKDIKNIGKRLNMHRQNALYLGLSVVAMENKNALSVVRVAPNSPLANHIKMGDTVTKVNNIIVKNPDDLVRIIMSSDSNIVFELEGADKTKRLITIQV